MKVSQHSLSPRQRGFTLVELLTVISIIVVLMGMTLGIGRWAMGNAQVEKCRVQVKLFENNLEAYNSDNGEFPPGGGSATSSLELYNALYENGIENDSKVYMPELDPDNSDQFSRKIDNGIILDPFKHKRPYFYMRGVDENGEENGDAYNPDFDLWSVGPNGVGRRDGGETEEDLEDDITNWGS